MGERNESLDKRHIESVHTFATIRLILPLLTLRLLMSYIYIYDISSLRVNDFALILLTWRKW